MRVPHLDGLAARQLELGAQRGSHLPRRRARPQRHPANFGDRVAAHDHEPFLEPEVAQRPVGAGVGVAEAELARQTLGQLAEAPRAPGLLQQDDVGIGLGHQIADALVALFARTGPGIAVPDVEAQDPQRVAVRQNQPGHAWPAREPGWRPRPPVGRPARTVGLRPRSSELGARNKPARKRAASATLVL